MLNLYSKYCIQWYHYILRWSNFRVFCALQSAWNSTPSKLNNLTVFLYRNIKLRELMPLQICYLRFAKICARKIRWYYSMPLSLWWPVLIQINCHIYVVWSRSTLCALWFFWLFSCKCNLLYSTKTISEKNPKNWTDIN
jgi:hypothetical protein